MLWASTCCLACTRSSSSSYSGSSPRVRGTARCHRVSYAGVRFIPARAGNGSAGESGPRGRPNSRALSRHLDHSSGSRAFISSCLPIERLTQLLAARCQELAIEQPSMERIDRIVRSAVAAQDELFCAKIFDRLSPATRTRLEALLRPAVVDGHNPEHEEVSGTAPAISFSWPVIPGGRASPACRTSWPSWN